MIAFSRPTFGPEEEEAVAAVIRSGWVVGGPRLAEFEARFAERCGVAHAVGVSSWTAGAFLVLKALGIGPGDEVIVPSLTFIASVNVITHAGATPVFADVDPLTFNVDPEDVARKITPRTRALLPVDQIGLPCDIDRILAIAEAHKLQVIQDAACAIGSRTHDRPVGSMAPVTVFSLQARKVVTTGEGGMIVTNDAALAERLCRLRHQGMSITDFERHGGSPTNFESYPDIGYNFRITDIQASVGVCQLARLDAMLARRRRIAQRYLAGLASNDAIAPPYVPDGLEPNWQSFQVAVRRGAPLSRVAIMEALHARGIATRRGVMASHLEPPYLGIGAMLPHTERAAARCLQLPMHSSMTEAEADQVLDALDSVLRGKPECRAVS